jgi:hypothetical protein
MSDTFIVWGVGSEPAGLEPVDAVDHEDRVVIAALDPDFDSEDPAAETVYSLNWSMVVDADEAHLQALVDAGEVRGFAPRFA